MVDLERLRELAEAATPGEWERDRCDSGEGDHAVLATVHPQHPYGPSRYGAVCDTLNCDYRLGPDERRANAAHIAAASPATILSLISELEAMRGALAAANKIINSCHWYWPADDTSEDSCRDCWQDVVEDCDPGAVVGVVCGGVVERMWCATLPPAEDAGGDDDFEVCEPTKEAAKQKIAAELERRAALARGEG